MVIKVLDHVERCYSNADGEVIFALIQPIISKGEQVTVSFAGVDSLPSSFVNSAFIPLLEHYSFDIIRRSLRFVDSTKQINEMIKKRFDFEVNQRRNLQIV
jgi:hypothetical protein